jgi:pimeloyl-ACP methyl ester carboxylesterase
METRGWQPVRVAMVGRTSLLVWDVPPDQEEPWRRFLQELSGSRFEEYVQSRRRLGVSVETVWRAEAFRGKGSDRLPAIAEEFTVIATDLRGYGDSSKPETTPDHTPYSKRTMALDQFEVMRALGFERFALCGHDRGGRVGYRVALDHPGVVTKHAVLDIAPTWEAFSRADMAFGLSYWPRLRARRRRPRGRQAHGLSYARPVGQ